VILGTGELWLESVSGGDDAHSPLGSSACLANLRRAAANPELADWATVFPLVNGLSGLTVAVVRVAVEIIPNEGDLDSWFIPEREDQKGEGGCLHTSVQIVQNHAPCMSQSLMTSMR